MFGILFFVFIAICGALGAIWKSIDDVRIYKDTKNDFAGYYTDSRGIHREIGTGNPIAILKDDYGDEIMYTPRGTAIRNITETQRRKFTDAIQAAIKDKETEQTAYWCDLREYHENEWSDIDGCRYKDANNGRIYIVRTFTVDGIKLRQKNYISGVTETINRNSSIQFYMDIATGHLVRQTDGSIKLDKEDNESIDEELRRSNELKVQEFISDFNKKQDLDMKNKGVAGFYSHYYFNGNKLQSDTFLNRQWTSFCKNNGTLVFEKESREASWSH